MSAASVALAFLGVCEIGARAMMDAEVNPQLNDLGSFPSSNRKVPWDLLWLLR